MSKNIKLVLHIMHAELRLCILIIKLVATAHTLHSEVLFWSHVCCVYMAMSTACAHIAAYKTDDMYIVSAIR